MERRTRSLYSTISRVISTTLRSTRWTCLCLTSLTNVTKDWRNPSCRTFMVVFRCNHHNTYLLFIIFHSRVVWVFECERASAYGALTSIGCDWPEAPHFNPISLCLEKPKKQPKKKVFKKLVWVQLKIGVRHVNEIFIEKKTFPIES